MTHDCIRIQRTSRSALRTHRFRNEAAPINEHLVAATHYADFEGWLTGAALRESVSH